MLKAFTFTHHSFIHPEQLPVQQAPFMEVGICRPMQLKPVLFKTQLYCTFSVFRYTDTIVLLLPSIFSIVTCCTDL